MNDDLPFEQVLDDLDQRISALFPAALARAMEHVRGVSVSLAPVESGHLRGSAGVTVVGLEARLYYPGPYSRFQHFMLDLRHPQGGQALYLEQPMITEAPLVFKIIADMLAEAF